MEVMDDADDDSLVISGTCEYVDLNNVNFVILKLHSNVRSLMKKVGDIELLLSDLDHPKLMLLTATWLAPKSSLLNIVNYTFISSHRTSNRKGGVGIYVHSLLKYIFKEKSCNNPNNNIDYFLIQLLDGFKISMGCIKVLLIPKRLILILRLITLNLY